LVVNIADDMCLRPQNDLTPLNRTLNFPINNDAFGCNDSVNMRSAGDHEGRAVWFAFNPTTQVGSREIGGFAAMNVNGSAGSNLPGEFPAQMPIRD
jgi:hypothetical protein